MKVKVFAQYLKRLEETTLRNEITAILAELFKKSSIDEIDKICYLVCGRLVALHQSLEFNIAEKTMIKIVAYSLRRKEEEIIKEFKKVGDLGDVIFKLKNGGENSSLTVTQVYSRLVSIAQQEGTGSQDRKIKLFYQLLENLDPLSTKYIVRIPIGKLRLGFSDLTILDALSWMKTGDKSLRPILESAYNVSTDIGLVAKLFKDKGEKGLKGIKPRIGIPIRPALAGRLANSEEIIKKLGTHVSEPKYDGFRIQLHIGEGDNKGDKSLLFNENEKMIRVFSRRMDNTTAMFPEIAESGRKIPVKSAIFDGEAIGINPKTGKFLAFQETAQRKRKYDVNKTRTEIPLKAFIFDLLFLNGKSLLKKSFKDRRGLLENVFKKFKDPVVKLTPQKIVKNQKELDSYFNQCIKEGLEGTLSKKLESPYKAGSRDFTWVKHKRAMKSELADTLDCLVLGYYRGKGKRSNFGIGAFLVGIYEKKKERFLTIAKIGTGLSDKQWKEIRKKVDDVKIGEAPKEYIVPKELTPDVWASPSVVVEIEADEISLSPLHSSKMALRFPRMKRFRDKKPTDATSLIEVKNMYNIQKSK